MHEIPMHPKEWLGWILEGKALANITILVRITALYKP